MQVGVYAPRHQPGWMGWPMFCTARHFGHRSRGRSLSHRSSGYFSADVWEPQSASPFDRFERCFLYFVGMKSCLPPFRLARGFLWSSEEPGGGLMTVILALWSFSLAKRVRA